MTNNEISMKNTELWEQQKNEQSKSYYLFTVYRDLGPYRTIENVISVIEEKVRKCEEDPNIPSEEIPKVPTLSGLMNLSARWDWVDRCKEWDEHLDEVARTEQELAVKEMVQRHASDSKQLQADVLKVRDDPEFKNMTPTQKAWILNSVTHSYSKLALLERLSRGESTERSEHNHSGLKDFARTIESSIKKAKKSE